MTGKRAPTAPAPLSGILGGGNVAVNGAGLISSAQRLQTVVSAGRWALCLLGHGRALSAQKVREDRAAARAGVRLVEPRHHRFAFGLESERALRYTGCASGPR